MCVCVGVGVLVQQFINVATSYGHITADMVSD